MAFQAPRIIGGGQIIQPQAQGNPFKGITDEINIGRDRGQKQELIDLEKYRTLADEDQYGSSQAGTDWMNQYLSPDQQGGGGGFLGMVKGMFPGKGGSQQTSGLPFDPDNPESIKKYQSEQGLTVDGVAGPKTMDKAKQTSFQTPDRPTPLNPDYEEEEQWKGRPSPELSRLKRAGNWMKENIFNQQGFQGEGGGSGQGPLQKAPESEYKKQLHGGTAQTRDPYGYGNVQEDTSGAPKENIFTKAKDFITRPSNRKYESATEEGREMAKNLDLSDNDAVARFQEVMGMEADGIAGKNTLAAIRALQSGEHERATSGYRPDYQITGIGKQQGGYSLVGGGDLPGKRTGDKNPAMLEDGEYVLNRNAVKALGKGFLDHINDERYPRFQSGGFQEPDIAGGTAQLVQPPVMDNSKAFDFGGGGGGGEGGGEDKMAMASMAMKLFGMNQGGHVPQYQQGGTVRRPTGYQTGGWTSSGRYQKTQSQLEDEGRLREGADVMGKVSQMGVQSAADVNTYNKGIEERVKQEQNSPMGYLDWALDKVTPEFIEKAGMWVDRGAQQLFNVADDPGESNWLFGQHIPEGNLPSSYYDARRAGGDKQMDDYEKEQQETYQKSALELAGENPGVLSPADWAHIQGITSTPSPNPYAGMSNRAMKRLYKEAIQEEGSNPMDLMKQLYGDEWWKAQSQ